MRTTGINNNDDNDVHMNKEIFILVHVLGIIILTRVEQAIVNKEQNMINYLKQFT